PIHHGFAEYFGLLTGGTTYFSGSHPEAVLDPDRPAGTRAGREIYRGREVVEVEEYLTDVFTREAVDFIDRHAGGEAPFFLVLSYNAPHTPLQATREYMDTVAHVEDPRTRIYAAMVSSVDRGVGAVADRLAAHGIDDDTLVVFMSDNGCVGYAAIACSNGPFSGTKRFHLEGGIRIPFIMHWPNGLEGGQVYREPVISLDLFATFAGIAGASLDDGVVRDGVDLVPYLTGAADGRPHDILYWRAGPNRAIRMGRWKLFEVNRADPAAAHGQGRLLPLRDYPDASPHGQVSLLYDLRDDEAERANLADRLPERLRDLQDRLDRWESSLARPVWPSNRSTITEIDGELVQLFF
ncbi:MAG: sulfatase-like hydrolase/transferase, partial [Acidobacteria bacterium]|nr:sulfatase-like hydrolase/transferase [Acidobacteriota bacterium]